ncbi:MAG: glycosyltransferase family 2 protein [Actinobacteria bacterium]|nr:glycosyltransferase family 2 protein [Actinomycetota bacterium]
MRPAVYIPNFNGGELLARALESLRAQTREVDIVVVDNASIDGSDVMVSERFPEVTLLRLEENLGFGAALNRAVFTYPSDPLILFNNDAEAEPTFVEELLSQFGEGIDSVAGVLVQERDPGLIDSAGVIADTTLMGFDHLHGEPLATLSAAADPLGPTGGAALYRHAAFTAVGGFDERIFLYYEDLDLALRLAAQGGRCRLARGARAVHAYSASLGAGNGAKYARTGWSRGYMLRRYGVMRDPRMALRVLTCEAAIVTGQLLRDRTAQGLLGRLRGFHQGSRLPREAASGPLLKIGTREALARRWGRRGRPGL